MSNKKEKDGYLAWHPKALDMRMIPSTDLDGSPITKADAVDIITRAWAKGSRVLSEGWRIIPVKLVFLDEEGGK